MSDMRVRIDPATLMIDGIEGRTFTADEFAALVPPDCPVCGTQVRVQQVDITLNAADEAAHGRSYIAGMWDCTCGDTTVVLSEAEGQAWRAEHRPPREVTGE